MNDADARRYYRVAQERLEDGRLLLRKPLDRRSGARYLSGYAVECIMKSLLVSKVPASERKRLVEALSEKERKALAAAGEARLVSYALEKWLKMYFGHDLVALRKELSRRDVNIAAALARDFAFLATWSPVDRYDPATVDLEDAKRFVAAARRLVDWAEGSY